MEQGAIFSYYGGPFESIPKRKNEEENTSVADPVADPQK
jgi:hypothetical protein